MRKSDAVGIKVPWGPGLDKVRYVCPSSPATKPALRNTRFK